MWCCKHWNHFQFSLLQPKLAQKCYWEVNYMEKMLLWKEKPTLFSKGKSWHGHLGLHRPLGKLSNAKQLPPQGGVSGGGVVQLCVNTPNNPKKCMFSSFACIFELWKCKIVGKMHVKSHNFAYIDSHIFSNIFGPLAWKKIGLASPRGGGRFFLKESLVWTYSFRNNSRTALIWNFVQIRECSHHWGWQAVIILP